MLLKHIKYLKEIFQPQLPLVFFLAFSKFNMHHLRAGEKKAVDLSLLSWESIWLM